METIVKIKIPDNNHLPQKLDQLYDTANQITLSQWAQP